MDRRITAASLAGICALLPAGCGTMGIHSEPTIPPLVIDLPQAWSDPAQAGLVDGSWWMGTEDAVLGALITEAIESNQNLKQAAAQLDTAKAQARISGAVLSPTLDASGNAARQRQNFSSFAIPGVGDTTQAATSGSFGIALNLSWELDLWGRLRAGASAAGSDLQAQRETFRAAHLSLAAQTTKAWYAVTEARLQLELAERTVDNFRDTFRLAKDRAAAGVQAAVDEPLAEANLAAAEATLQVRGEALSSTRRQLEILLGRYPRGEVEGAAELPKLTGSIPAGIPADVIGRRPDVSALERKLAAELQRVDAASKALYPRLTLTGSSGSSTADFKDLLSGDFFVWNIAGGLVQPLLDGGRLRAEVMASEGRAGAAAAAFAQGVLDAFSEVENSLAAERFLAGQESALQRAAAASEKAVGISQNRYGQGIEQLLVVLESQRRALDAQRSLLQVRRARLDARIDLHLALGGNVAVPSPKKLKPVSDTEKI